MSLLSLEKFDCNGKSTSMGARWERWKRALFIYLEASNIDEDVKKKASLVHFGALDLQEVFYNIPGANVEPTEGKDVFEVAISKLDAYFAPNQNKEEELKHRDIIEPIVGSSKWVSPVVPVLKGNGAIVRENYPLPTMDKLLPKMKNAKVFTILDIKVAFHQLEIDPASRNNHLYNQ
ncbi:unnamed protein product [Pieris macdunnoughi]|uniref:Reverse transcriptase n=1 Tax=Pieris macdunnoughi TaxID=345717 RepID=A0A821QUE5_9NEOP|nr:unnamed protein product [Pieris macdunnoughi]